MLKESLERIACYDKEVGEAMQAEFARQSRNLELTNEFMRFLVTTEQMNQVAADKRMVTPCVDMTLDAVYAAFNRVDASRVINLSELGLADITEYQVRKAGWQVSNGLMTVDEAVAAFGTLQ